MASICPCEMLASVSAYHESELGAEMLPVAYTRRLSRTARDMQQEGQ